MTRIPQAGRRLACGGLWLKEHLELARSLSRCCDRSGAEVLGGGCSLSAGASPPTYSSIAPSLSVPKLPCSPVSKIVVQHSTPSPTNDVVCDKSYNSSVPTLAVGCVSHGPGAEPRRRCPRGPQGFRPLAPVPTSQAPTWNFQHGPSLYVRAIDCPLLLPL